MSILDSILRLVPSVRKPTTPLSFREKLKWTAAIMAVYFIMFSTPALGVNTAQIKASPVFAITNIIFAARIGTLITVGIGPIVLSSIILQLLQGAGLVNIDLNDMEQKGKFQSIQKLTGIIIAVVEAIIYAFRVVPLVSPSAFWIVAFQFALASIFIIFLDEMMVKYGITSGINLFIAGGVSYALVTGTTQILFPEATAALAAGGASALPNAILSFGPLFFSIVIMLLSIYVYDVKIELPLAFSQFRGVGGRLPIPFLYVSVLPVILATTMLVSANTWAGFIIGAGSGNNILHFIAYYQNSQIQGGGSSLILSGGLLYLVSPNFPQPYSATYGGIGGYGPYFQYIFTSASPLYVPWSSGIVYVPEWIHVILYTVALIGLCVIFGKFWIEMTGQSPKAVSEQLQDVGWQIPGFRRDPRIIEGVLNKYMPSITVLGSIFVGFLAVISTLTGAIGGIGVLLMVGIMYMIYQQLEQENTIAGYPQLNRLLS